MNTVYIFGGEKGGVGKTTAAISFVEALLAADKQPVILDADPANPDVLSKYKSIGARAIAPDSLEAWGEILQLAESSNVVVNLPARGLPALAKNADLVAETAEELGVRLVFFHVLNRQKESVFLLAEAVETIGTIAQVVAVRNLYFGTPEKFSFFNSSPARSKVAVEVDLPELQDWVADKMMTATDGKGVGDLLPNLPALDRAALKKWLKTTAETWQRFI